MGARILTTTQFNTIPLSSSVTRKANTTQYAAGDVISDATGDAHLSFNPGTNLPKFKGMIEVARFITLANKTAAVLPDIELWLFSSDIATVADNEPFAPSDVEILTLVGLIKFPVNDMVVGLSGAGASGNVVQEVRNLDLVVPYTSGTIYGQLVVRNTYTPISAEVMTVQLVMSLDE